MLAHQQYPYLEIPAFWADDGDDRFYPCSRPLPPLVGDAAMARAEGNDLLCAERPELGVDLMLLSADGPRLDGGVDGPSEASRASPTVDDHSCQQCGARFSSRDLTSRHLLRTCFRKSGLASATYTCTAQGCGEPIFCTRAQNGDVQVHRACHHRT